jgi:hypothetical protein
MPGPLDGILDLAMQDIAGRSKKRLYQTDFIAWANDVLDRRYYEKMADIGDAVATNRDGKTRTAVKSANGCGKSLILSDFTTWFVSVHPPQETLAIVSAPTLHQIENVVFKYLKANYGYVKAKSLQDNVAFPFVGWINESLEWKFNMPGVGNQNLVFGKRPTDTDIVSTFQGTRGSARTLVALDEGGGIPTELFTAAEAVATGGDVRIVTIGNPDRRATEFHRIFTDDRLKEEWSLHTISAYDLPTMTGEVVYDDPARQAAMLKGLTSREWIEHKERVWRVNGKPDARFLAKVLGEFPGETDNAFFAQEIIDLSFDTVIDEPGAPTILGVDLAGMGDDESVVMVNKGGNIRVFDREVPYVDGAENRVTSGTWSKEDEITSARRVHAIAMYLGAEEVRVDASGMGKGIFSALDRLDEFSDKCYILIGFMGANSAPDKNQWNNYRSFAHDSLRGQMRDGSIDLDPNDTVLRDQLLSTTYDLDNRGRVAITKKADMRSEMHGSPDRLDATINCAVNVDWLLYDGPKPGDMVMMDPVEMLEISINSAGWPI